MAPSLPESDPAVGAAPPGILVADDEAFVRDVLRSWLTAQGFRVWTADDGAAAVEVYRQHAAAIALVLLDVRMPGLDGPETLAVLRTLNPAVRVAFMSGHARADAVDRLLDLGACGFLAKPFHLEHVAALLRQWTSQPETVPEKVVAGTWRK